MEARFTIEVTPHGDGFLAAIPGTVIRATGATIPMSLRRLGDYLVSMKCHPHRTYQDVLEILANRQSNQETQTHV